MKLRLAIGLNRQGSVTTLECGKSWVRNDRIAAEWLVERGYSSIAIIEVEMPEPLPPPPVNVVPITVIAQSQPQP